MTILRGKRFLAARIAGKVREAVSSVSEVAEAVNAISGKISVRNYIALGTIATGKAAEYLAFDPDKDPSLIDPVNIPYDTRSFLKGIAQRYNTQRLRGEGGHSLLIAEVHGATMVFKGYGWDVNIWIKKEPGEDPAICEERTMHAMGRAVWETLGASVELASGKQKSLVHLQPWGLGHIFDSEQTTAVLNRTRKLMALGGPRSLLLHGPPGTGKTCMARAIASSLNGTSLSLTARYLKDIDDCTLSFVLGLLSPDVLLIDDIDRVHDCASLLPAIDRIRARTRLVMVTVNHIGTVDSALKRAGRFDDLIEVCRVQDPSSLIPGLDITTSAEINGWPVAYVTELKARIDAFGHRCLETELADLRERVATNGEKQDEKTDT